MQPIEQSSDSPDGLDDNVERDRFHSGRTTDIVLLRTHKTMGRALLPRCRAPEILSALVLGFRSIAEAADDPFPSRRQIDRSPRGLVARAKSPTCLEDLARSPQLLLATVQQLVRLRGVALGYGAISLLPTTVKV